MTIANRIARRLASLATAALLLLSASTVEAQTVIYYHTDALGSPVATTNAAGAVIERSEYEPYGQVLNGPVKDGPGYTGHVSDAQTGLSYMQQRYYDPLIGRFLSMDPVTADAVTGANFNRYWYANNNPYKFTDPDGRQSRENVNPPSTGIPFIDWLMTPSDKQGSQRQMMEKQFASELSQPQSAKDVVRYVAIAMSAGTGAAGAAGAGRAAGAAGMTETAGAAATGARALSVEEKAAQLSSRAGANSVTVRTAEGQVRYDLQGASHFSKAAQADVPTPHVQAYQNNVIPSGPNAGQVGNVSKSGEVRAATMQDLRTVEKVLERRGQ